MSKLSHAATCAEPCAQIKQRLAGQGDLHDPPRGDHPMLIGNLFEAVDKADQRRAARVLAPRPARFRYSPTLWMAFLAKVSPLPVRVAIRPNPTVWIDTPCAHSEYGFTGGVWALAQGPGDKYIYELLTKYLYEIPGDPVGHRRWEPDEYFQADAVWPYGEDTLGHK